MPVSGSESLIDFTSKGNNLISVKRVLEKPSWRKMSNARTLLAFNFNKMNRSYVIEQIRGKLQAGSCLAYFYCNTATKDRSEPASILRAILRQVCIAYSPSGLPHALVRVKKQKELDSSGPLTVYEAQSLITELSRHLSGLWIVIDALDECNKTSRSQLFDALKTIEKEGLDVRIFVTARSEGDIIRSMDVPGHDNYWIEASDNTTDIEQYIRAEIRKLYDNTTSGEATEQLSGREERLVTALKKEAKGM